MVLFALLDLWKEGGGHSNFQFFGELPFPQHCTQLRESLEHLIVVPFYIILVYYEHYDIYFWNLMLYYFYNVSFLCVCLCTFSLFLHVHFICMLCV